MTDLHQWIPEADAPRDGEEEFLSCALHETNCHYYVVKWMGGYWVEIGDYQEVEVDYVMRLPIPPAPQEDTAGNPLPPDKTLVYDGVEHVFKAMCDPEYPTDIGWVNDALQVKLGRDGDYWDAILVDGQPSDLESEHKSVLTSYVSDNRSAQAAYNELMDRALLLTQRGSRLVYKAKGGKY